MATNSFWCLIKHYSIAYTCLSELLGKMRKDEQTLDKNLEDIFYFEMFHASANIITANTIHIPDILKVNNDELISIILNILSTTRLIRDRIMISANSGVVKRKDVVKWISTIRKVIDTLHELSKALNVKICEVCENDTEVSDK